MWFPILKTPIKLKFARKAIARLATELTKREKDEAGTDAPAPVKATKSEDKAPVEEVQESKDETAEEETKEPLSAEQTDEKA